MKMRKIIFWLLIYMISISSAAAMIIPPVLPIKPSQVSAPSAAATLVLPCGPSLPPSTCTNPLACGAKECIAAYEAIEKPASAKCVADYNACAVPTLTPNTCPPNGPFGEPEAPLYTCTSSLGASSNCVEPVCVQQCQAPVIDAYISQEALAMSTATATQTGIVETGNFFLSLIPCSELINCFMQTPSFLQTAEGLKMAGGCLTKQAIKYLLAKVGETAKEKIDKDADPKEIKTAQAMVDTKYKTGSPKVAADVIITCADNCDKNQLIDFLKTQDASILEDQSVRDAMARTGTNLPWWKHAEVIAKLVASNPHNKVEAVGLKTDPSGKEIYIIYFSEDGKEGKSYSQVVYNGAQKDINTAKSSAADGVSTWTNCPGHRSSECAGKPICILDTKDGASQCIATLPKDSEVKFGSIHVIDNALNNMFSLFGKENQGVVYQKNGYVNIDKGGTTKISVAGQGALITDINGNQLYLGKGTTTYFGIGNADFDTYLTNTFIFDSNSKVAVNAVNEIEQNRFKNNANQVAKQNKELAFTINKYSLKPYKNAVDVGNLQSYYRILTSGSSNIILADKNKIFPLMARGLAKGDSLIVKNKNIKISNTYIVNDGNYEYAIQAIGDSTKALAKNKKIIEDSGPLDKTLSERQSLLIYGS